MIDEEMAEEWVKENMDCVKTVSYLNHDCNYFSDEERSIAKSAFKDGYNKANEWHYPSKGEYPIDKTEMLVYFKYADYEYPCKTFGFYNGHFWDTKRGDVSNKDVIAWKEIVLPKEVENA